MVDASPKCVALFDMGRHRSNLFFRFLCTHPQIQSCWHPFANAYLFGPQRIFQHTKKANRAEKAVGTLSDDTYLDAEQSVLKALEAAETNNKIFVMKEHSQVVLQQRLMLAIIRGEFPDLPANPTVYPDSFLLKIKPIFIIRHPVFSVPSSYTALLGTSSIRPGDEDWDMVTSTSIQRRLFDFFLYRDAENPPLVVDGDDVVWETRRTRERIASALKLDPQGIRDMWEPVPEDQRTPDPMLKHFLKDIDDSSGIIRTDEKRPDDSMEAGYERWKAKWGEEVARLLKERAEENLPHYEYMRQFAS